jgi:hypothetical protein
VSGLPSCAQMRDIALFACRSRSRSYAISQWPRSSPPRSVRTVCAPSCFCVAQDILPRTADTHKPCLFFCSSGKVGHGNNSTDLTAPPQTRTTCVVACLRRYTGWAFSSILDEFSKFAEHEDAVHDWAFIECFTCELVEKYRYISRAYAYMIALIP